MDERIELNYELVDPIMTAAEAYYQLWPPSTLDVQIKSEKKEKRTMNKMKKKRFNAGINLTVASKL
jgi:hypothetical protein